MGNILKRIALKPGQWGALLLVAAAGFWLFFVHGYSTGYFETRDPIWKDMRLGYQVDGGQWSFGYFVPFATLILAWLMRREFAELEIRPANVSGPLVLFLGLLIYYGGYRANVLYVGYLSGQVLILGLILWFFGWGWFRKGFWLWCLFGLVWPNVFLLDKIALPLQYVMVRLTSEFLNLVGVETILQGTIIFTNTPDPSASGSETITLNVAAGCSGIRSLFALAMIGLVFSVVFLKKDRHRVLLMGLIPLVAVVGNFVRMLMLYYGSRFGGSEFAIGSGEGNESTYHIASGLVVFVVALMLLTILVEVIRYGFSRMSFKKTVRVRKMGEATS